VGAASKNERSLPNVWIVGHHPDFSRRKDIRRGPPFRTLTKETDGISIKQHTPPRTIEKRGHQVMGGKSRPVRMVADTTCSDPGPPWL
jgi:hypothetical protein